MQSNIWRPLSIPFSVELADALQQQHYAAQYIALAGRYLIPPQADDSHTSMQYMTGKETLVGNPLSEGMRLALRLIDLTLFLSDKNYSDKRQISLVAKTRDQAFELLRRILAESGLDISNLHDEMHYKIPDHELDHFAPFAIKDKESFRENVRYRHNAEVILKEIIRDVNDAEPVRVWPHHFDTATLIPLKRDGNNLLTQSLGLGWAIPDSISAEPYYYLSIWPAENPDDFKRLPALKVGDWYTSGWQGGILKLSEILQNTTAVEQYEQVELFFKTGIDMLTTHFSK